MFPQCQGDMEKQQMSQKSANMARRLFAAAGSDERWVMGDENSVRNNSQANAQSAAEVMHKEREEEKEKIPHTPLREKEEGKETTGSVYVSGSRVRVRVGAATFFDPALDPVSVAVAVFGGNHDDRRLWRWYLYRIGEDAFRQLAFTQWRENRSDGMPQNPPACFQRKLTNALNAQSAAANPGEATSSLPLPEAFVLRALPMARWDVWDAYDAWDNGFLKFALRASRKI